MKRSKKWFIACLTLFALVVPYLLTSSDVNALRYDVAEYPFSVPFNKDASSTYGSSGFYVAFSEFDHEKFEPIEDPVIPNHGSTIDGVSSAEKCAPISMSYANYVDGNNFQWSFRYFNLRTGFSYDVPSGRHKFSVPYCSVLGPFVPPTRMQWHLVTGYKFQDLNPYWYDFSGAFAQDVETEDGLKAETKFNLSDMFKSTSDQYNNDYVDFSTLKRAEIPLGVPDTAVGQLTQNRQIRFEGNFWLDSMFNDYDPTTNLGLDSQFKIKIRINGLESDLIQTYMNTYNCSYKYNRETDETYAPHHISYKCDFRIPQDFEMGGVGFTLILMSDNPSSNLFSYRATSIGFNASYVITDNDDTPSNQPFAGTVTGKHLNNAPGSAKNPNSSNKETNFLSSLTGLFSFDLLNPFRPLFDLFMDQNSCAEIPIIAGMIHSQETRVCPWFSANTRNIVTPVLGIASIMLLFGFIVKWLGARSGNFFEDTTDGHDVGSIHIGRRGKK